MIPSWQPEDADLMSTLILRTRAIRERPVGTPDDRTTDISHS
jgi:hypothetical protein